MPYPIGSSGVVGRLCVSGLPLGPEDRARLERIEGRYESSDLSPLANGDDERRPVCGEPRGFESAVVRGGEEKREVRPRCASLPLARTWQSRKSPTRSPSRSNPRSLSSFLHPTATPVHACLVSRACMRFIVTSFSQVRPSDCTGVQHARRRSRARPSMLSSPTNTGYGTS